VTLPSYVPKAVCGRYIITRDYAPYDCYGFPIFQSLDQSNLFMWYIAKSFADGVNDYVMIGHGASLCLFDDGILTLKLGVTSVGMDWTEKMQLGKSFSFFNSSSKNDEESGAAFQCLSYRLPIASPPPPPPFTPPSPPAPEVLPLPPPPPGNFTDAGTGVRLSTSAVAGAAAGSAAAVCVAIAAARALYAGDVRDKERRGRVLVAPRTSARFLF
jgi:hypothetical protein